MNPHLQDEKKISDNNNMIRMACGIEDTQDLIADLKQALD